MFLSATVAVYVFGIYPKQRLHSLDRKSVELLRPRFAADNRFHNVYAGHAAGGGALLVLGVVQTDADLNALLRLIEEAHLPLKPVIGVRVSPDPQ